MRWFLTVVVVMVVGTVVFPQAAVSQDAALGREGPTFPRRPGDRPLLPSPAGGAATFRPGGSAFSSRQPTITDPGFDCGRPWTNSNTNRRTREANPQGTRPDVDPRFSPIPTNIAGQREEAPPEPFCGATVISDRFLLTAATCVINPDRPVASVRLGDLDITQDNERHSKPADYAIQQIIVHPDFNPNSGARYNDVALLQTASKIEFNEYVFPYCLSSVTPSAGSLVTGAGFGHVNETHTAGHLQEAELRVVDTRECEEDYREAGQQGRLLQAYPDLLQNQDVLCAGHPGRGACKGDEGGPLFRVNSGGRRFLTGIISFTGPCDKKNNILPGVYTNVAYHIPFINSVLYSGV